MGLLASKLPAQVDLGPDSEVHRAALVINLSTYQAFRVEKDGARHALEFSGAEFRLMLRFLPVPGRVYKRDDLIVSIWTGWGDVTPQQVDEQMRVLREKLNGTGIRIDPVDDDGYRMVYEPEFAKAA